MADSYAKPTRDWGKWSETSSQREAEAFAGMYQRARRPRESLCPLDVAAARREYFAGRILDGDSVDEAQRASDLYITQTLHPGLLPPTV